MVLSLSVASALWSGVAIINEQARNSYNKAGEIFEQSQTPLIISSTDTFLPDNLFAKFRRIGVLVSPIISGKINLKGEEIELFGIEAVTHRSPYFEADLNGDNLISFILPPYEVFMNQETNEKLKDSAKQLIEKMKSKQHEIDVLRGEHMGEANDIVDVDSMRKRIVELEVSLKEQTSTMEEPTATRLCQLQTPLG